MEHFLKFLRLPSRRKRLVLEALWRLPLAWLLVRLVPFNRWSRLLGEARAGEVVTENRRDIPLLKDVRWAILAVNRRAGGRFTCLMQGMAAKAMLNRRGVPNTLVLGARLNGNTSGAEVDAMAAHAWLRAGPAILLGGESTEDFVPVTSYHSGSPE